ncbi:class I SAM-dependent methyltransferase [Undibacterium sp. SXout7W]|uniref:class I SAM-dependent methyltransferase n=1 Tax=Undibacterium sp. SXout7W TaxID=3413049 RepID=UPI003BF24F19
MNQAISQQLLNNEQEKTFLHVGCGRTSKPEAGPGFQSRQWRELRLDIDPDVKPDIIGSMTDMSALEDGSVDAVFSSHNIEHLYPHEVPVALKEFIRVLKPDGFAVITCPDLQSTAEMIVSGKLLEPAYVNPVKGALWPVCPIDIFYGHRASIAAGQPYMAHHCGFTLDIMLATLKEAGFPAVAGGLRRGIFDMWVIACKEPLDDHTLFQRAEQHFPFVNEPAFVMDPLVSGSKQTPLWSSSETRQTALITELMKESTAINHTA